MRVLHLIESIDGPPCATALSLLRDLTQATPGVEHRIGTIGSADLTERMESVGLRPSWHLPVPSGQGWLAVPRLWRRIRRDDAPADLLHAWSPRGAMLAGLTARGTRSTGRPLATLSHPPVNPLDARLRWLLRRAPCPVLTLSPEAEVGFRTGGMDAAPLHPVEPGVDPARIADAQDRQALREAWGVQDEQTPVVLAAGDPPEAVDAPTALLSIGMVRETGRPVRLLISPRAEGLRRAARIAAEAGRAELLAVPPLAEQPWRSLPGVDLVLAMNAGLSTAWGMAGAKPIAAPATPGLRHQLTDDKTALLGPPGKEGELARRVIQLLEQPERSRQLADRARQEAARRYDPARYAERMHAVYTALLENRPLPEAIPPPGSHANPDPTPVSRDPHATDPPDPRHEPPRAESAAQNRAP